MKTIPLEPISQGKEECTDPDTCQATVGFMFSPRNLIFQGTHPAFDPGPMYCTFWGVFCEVVEHRFPRRTNPLFQRLLQPSTNHSCGCDSVLPIGLVVKAAKYSFKASTVPLPSTSATTQPTCPSGRTTITPPVCASNPILA